MWKNRFNAGDGISDKPRSGRPPIIPSAVNHRLLAFYCQHDPLPGFSRWSIRDAEKYLRNHPDILRCSISRSSIHRLLKLHALKPYRIKYFLQICDPDFFPKMEKIIKVYQVYYKYLFCLDECTGLQALERKAPKLPAQGLTTSNLSMCDMEPSPYYPFSKSPLARFSPNVFPTTHPSQ